MPTPSRVRGLEHAPRLRGQAYRPAAGPRRVRESAPAYPYLYPDGPFPFGDGDFYPGLGPWGGYGGYGWNVPRERTDRQPAAPAGMLSEQELRTAILWSRDICDRNRMAVGFLSHIVNFVNGDGFTVKVVLRGQASGAVPTGVADADGDGRPDADPSVLRCQQFWDEFCDLNGWGGGAARFDPADLDGPDRSASADRQREAVLRASRDGNGIVRLFAGGAADDGLPGLRFVDPENVRRPAGYAADAAWLYGVKAADGDAESREAYAVGPDDSDTEVVPAGRIVHLKANVDGCVRMGVPDFFAVREGLQTADGLVVNMGTVARALAAYMWITEYAPGVTGDAVRNLLPAEQVYAPPLIGPGNAAGVTGVPAERVPAGTNKHVSHGTKIGAVPITNAAALIAVEQAILRASGFRWGMPEFFSGDASNANFASTMVAGGPFEKAIKARQAEVRRFQQALAMRVLCFGVRAGRLTADDLARVTVTVTAPAVAIADKLADAQRSKILGDIGASPQTLLQEQGMDPNVEAANKRAWQRQFPPAKPPAAADGAPSPRAPRPLGEAVDSSGHAHKGSGRGGGQFTGGGGGGGDGGRPREVTKAPKSARARKELARGLQDGLADVVRGHAGATGEDFESAFHALMADPEFRSAHNRLVAARNMVEAGTGFKDGVRTGKLTDAQYAAAYKAGADALAVMRAVAAKGGAAESVDRSGHQHKGSGPGGGQFTGGGGGGGAAPEVGPGAGGRLEVANLPAVAEAHAGGTGVYAGAGAEAFARSAGLDRKTPEAVEAVRAFQGSSALNKYNRDPGKFGPRPDLDAMNATIDAAIAAAPPLPHAVSVFRGVDAAPALDRHLVPGGEFADPAHLSTSLDRDYVQGFHGVDKPDNVVMQVRLPAGTRALYAGVHPDYAHERELILPRGSRYRVASVSPLGRGRYVVADYLGPAGG